MKKSKHKRSSLEALLAVQTAPTVRYDGQQRRETLASFTREYERQQDEAEARRQNELERPIREVQRQITENLRKLRLEQAAALFNAESAELMSRCTLIESDQFADKSVQECRALILGAFDAARLALEDQGIRLEASALQKLEKISRQNLNIDWTNPLNWKQAFDYADELRVFSDTDVSRRQVAAQQPQPVREAPVNPLDALDALPNTREGARAARELANEHYWKTEAAPLWGEWVRSLENHFGYVLPESVARKVCDEFQQRNWSYLDRRNFDRVRVSFVRLGLMPISCLTRDEALAMAIEDSTVPLTDYDARQGFVRRAQALKLQQ